MPSARKRRNQRRRAGVHRQRVIDTKQLREGLLRRRHFAWLRIVVAEKVRPL